jgi:hypothetical protein
MLPGGAERWIEIPEGQPGSWMTLERMASMIRASAPIVETQAARMAAAPPEVIFEWVRSHMLYTPDFNNGDVIEEIKTPEYLLREIAAFGHALGDCDDYVVLLGALYLRQGRTISLTAISRHADQLLDHVYLTVDGVSVDGIVPYPFGWEVPASEVTFRMDYPLAA